MSEVNLWRRENLREMDLVEVVGLIVVGVAVRAPVLKEEEEDNPLFISYNRLIGNNYCYTSYKM